MSTESEIRFLELEQPALDLEFVRDLVREQYGISGEYRSLYSERDQNFEVAGNDGQRFILKISNSNELAEVIDFQVAVLRHLEERNPKLGTPRVIPNLEGKSYFRVELSKGSGHIVRLLNYVPGIPLDDLDMPISSATRRQIGQFVAEIDIALQGFFHPAAQQDHPWDLAACARLRPLTHHIVNSSGREMIDGIFEHATAEVLPLLATLRHQVIHQDAHDGNLLVDANDTSSVVGLIDFGDMLFGAIAAEVAVTSYSAQTTSNVSLDKICAVVAGFDDAMPLIEEEVDLIFDLIQIRHAMTATIVATRVAEGPSSKRDTDGIRSEIAKIEQLAQIGRADFTAALRRACRFPARCPTSPSNAISESDINTLITNREETLGPHTKHFYDTPLHFERASGVYLYGTDGHRYLDFYNNVPQVGHCNPHVVRAISRQAAALNTNTRYLYSSVVEYAERLTGKLAPHLDACIFVNSGSEANDVAWQMAQFATGGCGGMLMEDAYHGITDPIRLFSPGHPDVQLPEYLKGLSVPDPYRDQKSDIVKQHVADADRAISELNTDGHSLAAFMIDSAFCSSGVPDVPDGYLRGVEERVRAAGGLMICDEVQSGFGRMGQWWGHEHHGVKADIVTMGKPAGNGHPLGAVVTSRELLDSFMERTEFFSTFGGNNVACAAGNAVLDVIERDDLIENGRTIGNYLREQLCELGESQDLIGDVRGHGMLAGLEFVTDRELRTPASDETARLVELMRQQRVLVGKEGRFGNVLKLRPPLVLNHHHVDDFVVALSAALDQVRGS